MELKEINFTSEVKFDIYAARSGNIAIEFFNPKKGKPSGLGVTQADLWFHVITKPMSAWVTSVKRLKEYVATNPPYKVISCGGDDNASLYLYRQDKIFSDIFRRIDEQTTEEVLCIIKEVLQEAGVL